jgi:hypothetical protein
MDTRAPGAVYSVKRMDKARNLAAALALAALVAVVFGRAAGFAFLNLDDPAYLTENGAVLSGLSARLPLWAATTFHAGNWHPLTWLVYASMVEVFGLNPAAHHLLPVCLHAANSVLVFALFRRPGAGPGASFTVAALFALHPARAESVAWVAETKDVLAAFFGLLALNAYLSYGRRPRRRTMALVSLPHALALMAKPSAVVLPVLMLLMDFQPLRRSVTGPGTLFFEKSPLWLLSAAVSLVTIAARHSGGALVPLTALPFSERLARAPAAVVSYTRNLVFPLDLSVFYPGVPVPRLEKTLSMLGLAALTAWAAVGLRRKNAAEDDSREKTRWSPPPGALFGMKLPQAPNPARQTLFFASNRKRHGQTGHKPRNDSPCGGR